MSTPSQFGPGTPPPKRSSGSSVLVIILIIFGVLLLSCAGICGGCAIWTRSAAQSGIAYVELLPTMESAISAAQNDPQVTAKLGEPVEISSLPARTGKGELKPANEDFACELRGPNGTAKVKGSAIKADGFWKVTAITVQTSDGSTFTVPPPASGGSVDFTDVPEMPEETK